MVMGPEGSDQSCGCLKSVKIYFIPNFYTYSVDLLTDIKSNIIDQEMKGYH